MTSTNYLSVKWVVVFWKVEVSGNINAGDVFKYGEFTTDLVML